MLKDWEEVRSEVRPLTLEITTQKHNESNLGGVSVGTHEVHLRGGDQYLVLTRSSGIREHRTPPGGMRKELFQPSQEVFGVNGRYQFQLRRGDQKDPWRLVKVLPSEQEPWTPMSPAWIGRLSADAVRYATINTENNVPLDFLLTHAACRIESIRRDEWQSTPCVVVQYAINLDVPLQERMDPERKYRLQMERGTLWLAVERKHQLVREELVYPAGLTIERTIQLSDVPGIPERVESTTKIPLSSASQWMADRPFETREVREYRIVNQSPPAEVFPGPARSLGGFGKMGRLAPGEGMW